MIPLSKKLWIKNVAWLGRPFSDPTGLGFDVECEGGNQVYIRTYYASTRDKWSIEATFRGESIDKELDWGPEVILMLEFLKKCGLDTERISEVVRLTLTVSNILDRVQTVDDALGKAEGAVNNLKKERTDLLSILP